MAPNRVDERSLTVLVLDVSPVAWGDRDKQRTVSDQIRAAKKRSGSAGPARLQDLLTAVQGFCSAFLSLERESALILVATAGTHKAIVHPRKNALEPFFRQGRMWDPKTMREDLILGVTELVQLASLDVPQQPQSKWSTNSGRAAMAAGLSVALCCINRFLVAANAGGVSALSEQHLLYRTEDTGVLAMIGSSSSSSRSKRVPRAWSPRVFLIQASEDRPNDYNAIMNCAFLCRKQSIVIDGCFMQSTNLKSSPFLEQACDLTGGVFLAPSGAACVGGALTEVFLSVFLPPRSCRHLLNLPALNKVEFRARSFDTGETVDMAFCCNQCLSIFKNKPQDCCPTCQAPILSSLKRAKTKHQQY